jgi:hypothetical protein
MRNRYSYRIRHSHSAARYSQSFCSSDAPFTRPGSDNGAFRLFWLARLSPLLLQEPGSSTLLPPRGVGNS